MNKLLVALATVAHLAPHPFGVSPVAAAALYSGAYAPKRYVVALPILILLAGHLLFGFYEPWVMVFVYAGFGLSALVGRWLLRVSRSPRRLSAAVAIGAVVFFLVSNFSIWWVGMYPRTVAGLIECYVNGLPLLAKAMLVDGVYATILFGLHRLLGDVERREPAVS